jgi:PPP family 3-phenylpropionic acid transporter
MWIVNEWFPTHAQSRGQSLYTMMSYGVGGSAGGILAGWIWEEFSPEASFMMAVVAALIGGFFAIKAIKL